MIDWVCVLCTKSFLSSLYSKKNTLFLSIMHSIHVEQVTLKAKNPSFLYQIVISSKCFTDHSLTFLQSGFVDDDL